MSRVIKASSTDQYCEVKLWTVADGLPKTDADHSTSGLSIKYQIGNAAIQSVTVGGSPAPASMSAGGSHADWGIYHIGNGRYKIGLADAVVATAGSNVTVWIELTDCDSSPAEIYVSGYDGSQVAVGANTTTPATSANVADAKNEVLAKLPESGRASTQTSVDGVATTANSIKQSTDNLPADPADASDINDAFNAIAAGLLGIPDSVWSHGTRTLTSFGTLVADVATAVWGAGTRTLTAISDSSGITTLLSRITGLLETKAQADTRQTALTTAISGLDTKIGTPASSVSADIAAVNAKTTNLPSQPAAVGSAMNLADDAISAAKFDESTAFPLKAVDAGSTYIMRTGADGDTGETLSDQIDGIDGGGGGTGTGADTVTITVEDSDEDPIVNAKVRITLADETRLGTTDADGVVTFNVDGGGDDWTVAITKPGKSFAGATLTINGDTTQTYTMTDNASPTPSDPALCVARTYFTLNGTAIEGASLCAELLANSAVDSTILSKSKTQATTDANGYAELELVQVGQFTVGTGIYKITMTHNGITHWSRNVAMPDSSSAWIEDLAEA